jgi:hypothetical protein
MAKKENIPKVVQKNKFIREIFYSKKLDINDIKILKCIFSKVKSRESLFDEFYEIPYHLLDLVGVSKNHRYQKVMQTLETLANTYIVLSEEQRKLGNDKTLEKFDGERRLGLIRNDFHIQKYKNKIVVSLTPVLRDFLLNIENDFFTYSIENIAKLKNPNDIKVFELFSSWKNKGTVIYSVDQIREIFELQSKAYKSYGNLKKWLVSCINRINEKTDIFITFEEFDESKTKRISKRIPVKYLSFKIFDKNSDFNINVKSLINKIFLDQKSHKIYIKDIKSSNVDPKKFDLELINLITGGKGTLENADKTYIITNIAKNLIKE